MSESYILHDVMRKVKADGLFDSIRRDLITDIEQKSSYLDLKANIESLMSTYLSEHQWSSSLKKSELRERARRHIETSNLIKDTLPSIVNQYMQTCQQELVQPRLSSFVTDHIEHVYHSLGGTHVYHPSSHKQPIPTQQETLNQETKFQSTIPIKKEAISTKLKTPTHSTNKNPQTPNLIKKKISTKEQPSSVIIPSIKKKPLTMSINSIKQEKKSGVLSPLHSPNELVDISPSPPATISSTPSPPPPIVRIASPLNLPSNTEKDNSSTSETSRKIKRSQEINNESTMIKKKKIKIDDEQIEINKSSISIEDIQPTSTSSETDNRKLRPRRPNPKYSKEQFEIDDLNISEPSSPPIIPKTKKVRQLKLSTSIDQEKEDHHHFDTPSSPPPTSSQIETSLSIGDMSPEYGTSLPSPTNEKQQFEVSDGQSRTPSPVTVNSKETTSPRRLRPRRGYEKFSTVDNQSEKTSDLPTRTSSSKSRESGRYRTEQIVIPSTNDDNDLQQTTIKKTHNLSSSSDISSNDMPSRSISVPDNLNTTTDESQTTRVSPSPATAPVSKSFIWKPKISK